MSHWLFGRSVERLLCQSFVYVVSSEMLTCLQQINSKNVNYGINNEQLHALSLEITSNYAYKLMVFYESSSMHLGSFCISLDKVFFCTPHICLILIVTLLQRCGRSTHGHQKNPTHTINRVLEIIFISFLNYIKNIGQLGHKKHQHRIWCFNSLCSFLHHSGSTYDMSHLRLKSRNRRVTFAVQCKIE